ncbi:MAG: PAS domain S-box protein [Capsulimonas sp.]|uniref:PAS domain S-box protein n=1 Tax=Capsulimonas sp. TaxID=2494211 RepID=UPI003264C082
MTSRMEEILGALDDACVALDGDWRIVYANAEAARLAGESVEALIGLNHWEKWPELLGTRLEEEYRRVAREQTTAHFEHQLVFPEGREPLWLELRVHPSAQGGVILFFRDINARKQADALAAAHLRRETLIKRIAESALRAEQARTVLETAVAGLAEELGLDRCYYVLHDSARSVGTVICEWRRSDLPSVAGEYVLANYGDNISAFYQLGHIQVVDDANAPDLAAKIPLSKRLLDRVGLTALIRAPLSAGSAITALVGGMSDGPRVWTPEEIALVQVVASETAEVVQALQVQERNRRIAMVLQDALQPRIAHDVPGVSIDVYLKPALDEANVGGDFYDIFPVQQGRYAFVIGDVSGKGLEAAAQVSTVRNMLRAFLYQGASPSQAAAYLNDVVTANDLLVGFATLFVGVYDMRDRSLRYALCGHELPIVLSGDDVRTLETCGPPIGVGRGATYTENSIALMPGDLLALYTDGLSEAGPDWRTLLGSDGLTSILRRRFSNGQIEGMATGVVTDVAAFAEGRLRDDACLILMEWGEAEVLAAHSLTLIDHTQSRVSPTSPNTPQEPVPAVSLPIRPWGERHLDEQFRLLVESVADYAIFLLDPHGQIKTWNKGAERIKGYAASEIIGKHFSIFYTTEDVQRGHPLDELAIATAEGRYEEEGWRIRKDGSRFWANVVITALRDESGGLYGFAKVTRDFTERRRAEQHLRRSEERFRLLVQGVRDYAIFMMDPSGIVASWNEGAQRIKGYTPHEIVGQHFSRFYTPEDIVFGKPERELAIATAEGRYEEEGWRIRKDGSRFWANVVLTALKDESGGLYGFAKVTRDITDRRHAEEVRIQNMRDQISRSFLRDILYSVTEGRLRFCENDSELPARAPCRINDTEFDRFGLAGVRADVRSAATSLGISDQRLNDLVTAVSEAAMNAVVHAKSAQYSVCEHREAIQVWIKDYGNGIEISQLHRATLERGFTTEDSLGHGFWLMLHTCDRIWLHSSSAGTTLVLEQDTVPPDPLWLGQPRDVSQFVNFGV